MPPYCNHFLISVSASHLVFLPHRPFTTYQNYLSKMHSKICTVTSPGLNLAMPLLYTQHKWEPFRLPGFLTTRQILFLPLLTYPNLPFIKITLWFLRTNHSQELGTSKHIFLYSHSSSFQSEILHSHPTPQPLSFYSSFGTTKIGQLFYKAYSSPHSQDSQPASQSTPRTYT